MGDSVFRYKFNLTRKRKRAKEEFWWIALKKFRIENASLEYILNVLLSEYCVTKNFYEVYIFQTWYFDRAVGKLIIWSVSEFGFVYGRNTSQLFNVLLCWVIGQDLLKQCTIIVHESCPYVQKWVELHVFRMSSLHITCALHQQSLLLSLKRRDWHSLQQCWWLEEVLRTHNWVPEDVVNIMCPNYSLTVLSHEYCLRFLEN